MRRYDIMQQEFEKFLHSGHSITIGYKEVIAVIKTIRLYNVIFFFLLFATVVVALFFVLFAKSSDISLVSNSAKADKHVLVIDAGHGGADGGAVSLSGVLESELNLDIALRMAELSGLTGIKYIMTRDCNDISYPESAKSIAKKKVFDQKHRAEQINNTSNAILISIHQNCYPHKAPFGPQSFYSKIGGSDVLAKLVQNSMNTVLCPGNRRMAMPVAKDIYLFKSVTCPAVLVECGFVSNPTESELLDTESYRLKIATVLTCAYLQYMDSND